MRPLFHPAIDDVTVEGILHALSDPVRASIYARLAGLDCAATCTALQQAGERTIPKSSLSQHFRVLREAGLVRSERAGVEMHNTTRCGEIEQRFPGLIPAILHAHKVQAAGASAPPARVRRAGTVAVKKKAKAR
ncbi:MAG: helix-turn-helix domain-containing protein [Rhodanobacter sp.]